MFFIRRSHPRVGRTENLRPPLPLAWASATLGYRIEQQEIDQQLKRISASKYPLILYRERATGFGPVFRAYAPKSNLAMFTEAAASSGYFNLGIDQDDVIRWMPLMIQSGE